MIELYEKAAQEAFDNAKDMLDEAEILLQKKRFARSVAISVLASEEFAKSMFYKFRSLGIVSEKETLEFESAINDHKPKIKTFRKYIATTSILSENAERVRRLILDQKMSMLELMKTFENEMVQDEAWKIFENANQTKKRAFYVEVSNNKVLSPKHVVTEQDARKTLEILRQKAIPRFMIFLKESDASLERKKVNLPSLFQGID